VPPREWIVAEIAAMRGGWTGQVAWRWEYVESPIAFLESVGPETMAAMLLGMAGYRSGFLTGSWPSSTYRRFAAIALGITFSAYLLLGLNSMAHGFDQRWVYFDSILATVPFRVLGAAGYAALIILVLRPGGWLTARMAAVGRAAFTNYLGTSVLMTTLFYGWGLGQFARWNRAEVYLLAPLAWLLMLAWSKPWLDRYRYGPLEWLWRSLARWQRQPMRRRDAAAA